MFERLSHILITDWCQLAMHVFCHDAMQNARAPHADSCFAKLQLYLLACPCQWMSDLFKVQLVVTSLTLFRKSTLAARVANMWINGQYHCNFIEMRPCIHGTELIQLCWSQTVYPEDHHHQFSAKFLHSSTILQCKCCVFWLLSMDWILSGFMNCELRWGAHQKLSIHLTSELIPEMGQVVMSLAMHDVPVTAVKGAP